MIKKTLRKATNVIMLAALIPVIISALIHPALSPLAFRMMHVIPGFIFVVCALIHLNLNKYPFGRQKRPEGKVADRPRNLVIRIR